MEPAIKTKTSYSNSINNVKDDKLENEWIAGPGRNIFLRLMIVDFPRHLKLHLEETEDLLNTKS
jgi:hypothetical protein